MREKVMQPFTQKYALIQLFEPLPVGSLFTSSSWPLHSTVVDTFAIDWDLPVMIEALSELLATQPQVQSTVQGDRLLGENGQVRVAVIDKTDALMHLHSSIIALLETGGLTLNDPQFARDGYVPHATVQAHARLHQGCAVMFNALSLIDFFPDNDPYMRKLLATMPLGQS